jgi:F-type H+-transporting ATPase subunit gamma
MKVEKKRGRIDLYDKSLQDVVKNHLSRLFTEKIDLITPRDKIGKVACIFISGDKGLCGSFNTNLFKELDEFNKNQKALGREVFYYPLGKKGMDYLGKRGYEIVKSAQGLETMDLQEYVESLVDHLIEEFEKNNYDEIMIISTRFISKVSFKIEATRLLPYLTSHQNPHDQSGLHSPEKEHSKGHDSGDKSNDKMDIFIYEPDKMSLIRKLVLQSLDVLVSRAILESLASEFSARMVAMKGATDNAGDIIKDLTLLRNSVRQASITQELSEISGGAEALNS